ncbi:GLPGLI family protein [Chryseobacterium sp. JUb7]|uniref:GLPGLI family protein n=1 Tax=Chryseobacterium sp. JUb7 TaxID=2940599 RepID=UPI0021683CC3|nr:GLPGLI family protein [Chryseobacterium sp. JUb7]MCS3529188.1 GLPGLI family protein [Chryseobacterium sp. JUb7]
MKKYTFLFVLFCALYTAQVQRFAYEYQFIKDSTNKANITKELMFLDVDSKGSKYYSYDIFVTDSIINAEFEKQTDTKNLMAFAKPNSNYKGVVRSKVTKEYPNYNTYLHTSLSLDFYKIEEDKKPVWKIFPEKKKTGNYNAQKATTNYLGRSWIAWFCTDLPFQDGPYKFYGLPGLIVKLEDKTQSHVMTLIANKTINKEPIFSNKPDKEIAVNNDKFNKLWREYVQDPNKVTKQRIATSGNDAQGNPNFNFVDGATGKKIDANEAMRNNEKQFKDNLKKDNNRLDSDLYKY